MLEIQNAQKKIPQLMQIMADVYLANRTWLQSNEQQAIKIGISHVVI